jgi:hypothetical protein
MNTLTDCRAEPKIEADKPVAASAEELADQKTDPQLQKQRRLQAEREQHPELELPRIACYDTLNTTTFPLDLHKVNTKKDAAYEFVVPGSYFASLPAPDRDRTTQLDYSLCTFELFAHPLHHFDGTVQVGRNPQDYQLICTRGFAHTIIFEAQKRAVSARVVVRDRNTRAMGSGELLLVPLGPDLLRSPIPEGLTNDSFRTLNPTSPLAMCGDVYQLAPWITHLPLFSELDAVAPIYATSLGVYSRFFTAGIPNVTSRTEWFWVNYQGRFGVDTSGKYEFDLLSDDGAKVYIDDKLVVSDDTIHPPRHSRGKIQLNTGPHGIRVSYFEGGRIEVALVLLVKPPRHGWRLFDTSSPGWK